MKTITKNLAYVGVLMLMAVGAFAVSGGKVEATPNMSGGGLHPTVVISNYSECQGYGCWDGDSDGSTRDQATAGEIVSVGVYYKNTGTSMATGVRLKLTPRTTGTGLSHTFSGQVTSFNAGGKSGSARVDITGSSAQKLTYDGARGMDLEVYPSNSTPFIQGTENDLFSSNGLLIGNVPPGHDGMLTVHYDVSNNVIIPIDRKPEVHTTNVDLVTDDSARLHGDVKANGADTDTWFEYDTNLNDLQNRDGEATPRVDRGNSTSFINISSPVNNLQSGTTYYFMACAANAFGEVCDPYDWFKTLGTQGPVNGNIEIETLDAEDIDEDSAKLVAKIVDLGDGDVTRWFEISNVSRSYVENGNGTRRTLSGTQNTSSEFDLVVSNLQENETYYFRACGEDQSGNEDCGATEQFTTDDDGPEPQDNEPDVETHSAGDVDEDSAELRGEFDMNDADNGTSFFVWSDNRSDIEDVEDEDEINNISNDVEVEIMNSNLDAGDNDSSVEERISGLREDETYYYAFCLEYDDEDNDQHIMCGSVRSFNTDGNNDDDQDERPTVSTNPAINVGATYATLSGFYDTNDEDAKTFFEYGTTTSLNNRTSPINRDQGRSGLMTNSLSGLVPGQTYFFRACIDGDESNIRCGAMLSFKTVYIITQQPQPQKPPVVIVSGGTSAYVELDIDDGIETTQRRLMSTYEITWKNVSKSRLEKVDLQIVLPKALKFIAATKGQYSRADHKIIVNLDRLDPGEEGQMSVTVVARIGQQGDVVVTQAVLAFETPSRAQETAIEFDANTFIGIGFGFIPTTLVGWLLLILIILIIIILAQHYYERSRERGHGGHGDHGGHGGHNGGSTLGQSEHGGSH